jgi:hypothetical protein
MGYSIATPIVSEAVKQELLAFFSKHYRKWTDVRYDGKYSNYLDGPTDDLDYDHGPCRIGFNYNASGGEREYGFSVCRWMALHVGKRRDFLDLKGLGPVPYVVYDGHERFPVLVREACPDVPKGASFVDEYGVRSLSKIELELLGKGNSLVADLELDLGVIRKELERLTKDWRSYHASV